MGDYNFGFMVGSISFVIVLISWSWYSERKEWINKRATNKGKEYRIIAKFDDTGLVTYIPQVFCHEEVTGEYGWINISYIKSFNSSDEAQDEINRIRTAKEMRKRKSWVVREPA